MTIATKLDTYLNSHEISYEMLSHHHSNSSMGTAITSNVPLKKIAKAVILIDHQGRNLMAVLPANNKVSLIALNEALHGDYHLAKEQDVYTMFTDCENGAIPPIADAYNMNMVCDSSLNKLDNIYIEAGDHETLLKLNNSNFQELTSKAKQLNFSHEVYH